MRLAALAIPIMVLSQIAIFPAGNVGAVDNTGTFCMDGQIEPGTPSTCLGAPPYHWSDLFDASGNKKVVSPAPLSSAFVHDSANPDPTYFQPSTKDLDQIGEGSASWACTTVSNPTAKDNILNTYAAVFKIPTTTGLENKGDTVIYMGVERQSNNGDSFAGFWLLKDPTVGCSGSGSFSGHHQTGDTLILTNFTNGGGTASVSVFQWQGGPTGSLNTTPIVSGNVCGVFPGGTGGEAVCAISNSATIASPWAPTSHDSNTFTEAALDLTKVFAGGSASGPCFSNFLSETRSSQSTDATLKDYAGGLLNTCTQPPVTTHASGNGSSQFPGSAQHDTATVTGTPAPTGTATFFLCSPTQTTSAGCPSGAGTQVGSPVTLTAGTGSSTAQSTPDVTGVTTPNDLALGTYCWGAQYTPDTNSQDIYLASYGTDNTNECFTVAKASPAIATQTNPVSADLSSGPVLTDTATLTGMHTDTASGDPTGETVTFKLFGPYAAGVTPTCATGTGQPAFTTTGTLSGSGTTYTATTSTSFAAESAGTYVWTASYAGDAFNNGVSEGCNGTNETTTVTTPSLSITKTADNATVSAGDPIGFAIKVTNSAAAGTGDATGVTLHDVLPTGTGITWTIASQTGTACSITAGVLDCAIGTLTSGQSYSVHITSPTTASSCQAYPNTATANATNLLGGAVQASATTTVDCPNVSVLKTADNATVNAGSPIGFTVKVSNSSATGTGTAKSVTLSDNLPAGSGVDWSISPAYTGQGSCAITGLVGSQVLSCAFGDMAPGASASVHITSATAFASCATYQNTASVSLTNENGGPFTSVASTTVQCPGLHILKTADATPVSTGTSIGFQVTVSNAGPGTALGVTVNDPLPAGSGVDWVIASQDASSCSITGPVGTQVLGCTLGDMANGASYHIHITSVTTAASAGTYPNTATASSTNAPSVNSSATIIVLAPNMTVLKSADNGTVSAGSTIGFTVLITNPGTSADTGTASNVQLNDALPGGSGVSWSIASQTSSACSIIGTAPSQTLSCHFTTFTAGGSYSVHITSATAFVSCATYPNTATVGASNQTGTVSSSASTTVQCPSLGILKTADATPVSTGTTIGFHVTVSNGGPGTADSVTVNDPLPAGSGVDWVIASQDASACSITGPVGTQVLGCTLGDVASGASYHIHITSPTTAASAGTYPNTATASATNAPSVNSTATIVVLAPNMTVLKSADNGTVSAGSDIGFTVLITNPGTSATTGTATNVSETDTLPHGTGVSWSIDSQSGTACSITGTAPSQSLVCAFSSFAPGTSYSVHIFSSTDFASCADYPNTATVGASNQTGTVSSSASTTVQCPGLHILKTADATPVSTGTTIGFHITVSNTGTGTADSVTVNDPLPAGSGIDWVIASQDASSCSITGSVGSQVLGCTLGDMASGASYHIAITSTTTFASAGTYPNTATASATNAPSVNSTATIVVLAPALSITKTADATPVSTGTTIGFTVTVSNSAATGTGTATSVSLNDPLPAGSGIDWTISPAYSGPGSCSISGAVGSQTLSCSFGDMAPGASASVHISSATTAASAGTYPNTATVSATNAPSKTASATIVVLAPNMMVAKTSDNDTVSAGSAIGFTVTLTNPGTDTNTGTATAVTLNDPLPAGSGVIWSIDSQSGTACSISGSAPSQTLTCSFETFSPGGTYSVHVTSGTVFASCALYTNTATVGAGNQTGTVSATASTTVQCPSLTITKTADATPVSTGTSIGFTVTVHNGGPGTADGVMVNDPLPAGTGVDWSIASQSGSACSITGAVGHQVLVCSLGDMAADASYSIHITSPTTSGSAGTYPNTATASSTNAPSVNATATVVVQPPALTITKVADSASVAAGGTVGFTVKVSNSDADGTGTATDVKINDPLPGASGTNWSIDHQDGTACSITGSAGSQTLVCSIGALRPGTSYSVHITSGTTAVTAPCPPLNNTATVSSSNAPSASASASITLGCGVLGITTPVTGWGTAFWAAIPLMGAGLILLLGGALRRRRNLPRA